MGSTVGEGRAATWSREYLVFTVGIPCLGFGLLRSFMMLLDQGSAFPSDYLMYVVGYLARGVLPIIIAAFVICRPFERATLARSSIPMAVIASLCAVLYLLPFSLPLGMRVVLRMVCQGIAGWLYVCWAEVFRDMRIKDVAISMTASMAVPFAITIPCLFLPPVAFALCTGIVLLMVTGIYVVTARRPLPPEQHRGVFLNVSKSTTFAEHGVWMVTLALFSVVIGVIHAASLIAPVTTGLDELFVIYVVVSNILAALLLIGVIVRNGPLSLMACWTGFVVFTCLILLLSIVFPQLTSIALSIFAAFRYVALAFLNIKLVDIAHHSKVPLYLVFSIGWAIVEICMALGLGLAMSILLLYGFKMDTSVVTFIGILLAGSLFLLRSSSLSDVHIIAEDKRSEKLSDINHMREIRYRQCLDLRRRFGLTNRETEVTYLISQGYTQSYCADALMVSLNTVRTHIKHVYAKLDIHTKGELIQALTRAED